MTLCNKLMPKAKNGADRGFCSRIKHFGRCGNGTCNGCGIEITEENSAPFIAKNKAGECRNCKSSSGRERLGQKPFKYTVPGTFHTFRCGCSGVLPNQKKASNTFASWANRSWYCRIGKILRSSRQQAKRGGYLPINPNISHSVIRAMMEEPNCWRCKKPLMWDIGAGKTPHLHHNHDSGEVYGFTHVRCNPKALEHEIDELRKQLVA